MSGTKSELQFITAQNKHERQTIKVATTPDHPKTLKIAVIHLVAFQFTLCKHVKQSNEHLLHDRCQHAQSEVLRRDLWPLPKFSEQQQLRPLSIISAVFSP